MVVVLVGFAVTSTVAVLLLSGSDRYIRAVFTKGKCDGGGLTWLQVHSMQRRGKRAQRTGALRASETSKCTDRQARNNAPDVFFLVLPYSDVAYPDHVAYFLDLFPAAVRTMVACCKRSVALRPGLSHQDSDK